MRMVTVVVRGADDLGMEGNLVELGDKEGGSGVGKSRGTFTSFLERHPLEPFSSTFASCYSLPNR